MTHFCSPAAGTQCIVKRIMMDGQKPIFALEYPVHYVSECDDYRKNEGGEAVWERPKKARHFTAIFLTNGYKIIDTLLCKRNRLSGQIRLQSVMYDKMHIINDVSHWRNLYAKRHIDGKERMLHCVIGVTVAVLRENEPKLFKELFGEKLWVTYNERASLYSRKVNGETEVMVRTDQGDAVVYMQGNGNKGDWTALNPIPETPDIKEKAYYTDKRSIVVDKLLRELKNISLNSVDVKDEKLFP